MSEFVIHQILREYEKNGMHVVEYTLDGINVSNKMEMPIDQMVSDKEVLPVPPSFGQRIAELEARNTELEAALVETTTVAAQQEQRSTQNEQAIVELTMLVGGQA